MYGALFMSVHLIAVIAFIGGTIFYFGSYRPAFLNVGWTDKPSPEQITFLTTVERKFRTIRWLSLITLLLTGFYNLLYEGGSARIESAYGGLLMLKILLVFVLMAMAAVYDFVVGPLGRNRQLAARRGAAPPPVERATPWLGMAILGLSLAIVLLAVNLRVY